MSTLRVSTIQDTAGSNSSTPAAIANGIAKAWVNFNGTGVVAIRAQYNVSSITDNGVGDYTVNFTSALADANYACAGMSGSPTAADTINDFVAATGPAAGSVRFGVRTLGGAFFDATQVHIAIFR